VFFPPASGARGPLAPVPTNQGLLNPLVPTNTSANQFVPTRLNPNNSQFGLQPTFAPLQSQITGFPPPSFQQPMPTGIPNFSTHQYSAPNAFGTQPLGVMATGVSGFSGNGFGMNSLQPAQTNFQPFASPPSSTSPAGNNHSPANIFASMKLGSFAGGVNAPQSSDKYDALRAGSAPSPLSAQQTGWVGPGAFQQPNFQGSPAQPQTFQQTGFQQSGFQPGNYPQGSYQQGGYQQGGY